MTTTQNVDDLDRRAVTAEAWLTAMQKPTDPAHDAQFRATIATLMEFHQAGLAQITQFLQASPSGRELLDQLLQNEAVAALLVLHGLHPEPLGQRVRAALARLGPELSARGAGVSVVGLTADGALRIRLDGCGDSVPSAQATVKQDITTALQRAAPEIVHIEFERARASAD